MAVERTRGEGGARVKRVPNTPPKKSWHESLPFPRHWFAYLVLKLAVIAVAIFLVLHYLGPF